MKTLLRVLLFIIAFAGILTFRANKDTDKRQNFPTLVPLPQLTREAKKSLVRRVEISAYTSKVEETDSTPHTTAAGTKTRRGVVAANFLPFGTRIHIPEIAGSRVFTVEDRMNRRYRKHVDIWVPKISEARNIGRRKVAIVILSKS